MASFETSTHIHDLLDRLRAGDVAARTELIAYAHDRLRKLTRRLFHQQSDLRALEQTDDVLQKALVRLHRALAAVQPPNTRAFFGLAATQVRRVLGDLLRELLRQVAAPDGSIASVSSSEPAGLCDDSGNAIELLHWTDFHAAVDRLPDEEREVFDLLWYNGLTQPEVAAVLDISLRTVKRRWLAARVLISEALHGEPPQL